MPSCICPRLVVTGPVALDGLPVVGVTVPVVMDGLPVMGSSLLVGTEPWGCNLVVVIFRSTRCRWRVVSVSCPRLVVTVPVSLDGLPVMDVTVPVTTDGLPVMGSSLLVGTEPWRCDLVVIFPLATDRVTMRLLDGMVEEAVKRRITCQHSVDVIQCVRSMIRGWRATVQLNGLGTQSKETVGTNSRESGRQEDEDLADSKETLDVKMMKLKRMGRLNPVSSGPKILCLW